MKDSPVIPSSLVSIHSCIQQGSPTLDNWPEASDFIIGPVNSRQDKFSSLGVFNSIFLSQKNAVQMLSLILQSCLVSPNNNNNNNNNLSPEDDQSILIETFELKPTVLFRTTPTH